MNSVIISIHGWWPGPFSYSADDERLVWLYIVSSGIQKKFSAFSTFLVPAHLGSPGQRVVKRTCVCVCVFWIQKNNFVQFPLLTVWVCVGDEWPRLQSGLLRLYTMRFCPYSHRVRLVLEYKTVPSVALLRCFAFYRQYLCYAVLLFIVSIFVTLFCFLLCDNVVYFKFVTSVFQQTWNRAPATSNTCLCVMMLSNLPSTSKCKCVLE